MKDGNQCKRRVLLASIAIFLILMSLPTSCGRSRSGWKGSIKEVDGTVIVNNPDEPLSPEPFFALQEDLAVGGVDERKGHIFFLMNGIAVDTFAAPNPDFNIGVKAPLCIDRANAPGFCPGCGIGIFVGHCEATWEVWPSFPKGVEVPRASLVVTSLHRRFRDGRGRLRKGARLARYG